MDRVRFARKNDGGVTYRKGESRGGVKKLKKSTKLSVEGKLCDGVAVYSVENDTLFVKKVALFEIVDK